jgi:cyclophilin family peptidyl-prolyl cis-trans isomerase
MAVGRFFLGSLCLVVALASGAIVEGADDPVVVIETSLGDIVVRLNPNKAPGSVENFLAYVNDGSYDGTIFHRVIPDFMIQGGGFTADFQKKPTRAPIKNEASNGLKNRRGTIVMARTNEVHSATSQFFINVKDNGFLNYKGPSAGDYGYAVFGEVTEGMDVVDRIRKVKTTRKGPFPKDVPVETVLIKTIRLRAGE